MSNKKGSGVRRQNGCMGQTVPPAIASAKAKNEWIRRSLRRIFQLRMDANEILSLFWLGLCYSRRSMVKNHATRLPASRRLRGIQLRLRSCRLGNGYDE